MSESSQAAETLRFKIGRGILVAVAALLTLNHAALIFVRKEPLQFTAFTAFNFYSLVVAYVALGRREKWAWYTTWALPITLAGCAFIDAKIAIFYYALAAMCAVGLLLSMGDVFSQRRASPAR